MKANDKYMKKHIIFIFFVVMLLIATMSTYAWVKREWNPSVSEENLKIETSGSLGIRLDDDPALTTMVSINNYVNSNTFTFKQVSNCTGKSDDFFTLDYSKNIENPKLTHLDITNVNYGSDYRTMGSLNGYIEFNFILYGNSSKIYKDVYIDEESLLRYNADDDKDPTNAIRISLSFNDNVQAPKHYILSKSGNYHCGINNDIDSEGKYVCDGQNLKTEDNQINYSLNKVFIPDDNNKLVRFGAESGNYYGSENVLYTMVSNQSINVTIRIWLEGTDTTCTDKIAGSKFDLKLIFNSRDHD